MIKGSIVAIVSPMHEDGSLDLESYRRLIDWHVEEGTAAIVAVGTTGESPTVDVEEHATLIRVAVEHAAGRVPVIAGTGGNSTREAIELTEHAHRHGAQASLQVVPYYNKPTQEGMYRHFRAVAEAVDLPIVLYNVPGRTVADLSNATVLRLAQVPGIVGLKDATGDIPRGSVLLAQAPADFAVYSGNDDSALALMAMGAHGVISVTANLAPGPMARMCRCALAGDWAQALAINRQLLPLHTDLYGEANPIPVKWALARMGRIGPGIRLPLTPLSPERQETVRAALERSGVLN
ncbi:MAG: 4-hydroxy-tetrahydrodipicolinate synthase [Lautropia sp.]|nr:MAG: 4-hydroxy-tetrahydrodipicolinate synthase [Pseudomonadota bacterium]MBC6960413.1 4-hydroxy-tetrahydrodipicolinate synthase [Lautropia sp.]MCL4702451.1 4-hydroxy-tetrahydrodipicolinate synthase [Burkholderiaceae bacterium]MCZ2414146.1 4-hydroxy-tetrahydrodipicolinate synthase [Burkholderiales bacterium]MDL1908286.1 4-hydroxy-tetrahydrodipicolinate synthase [Betaproteobacteria bacterium PRO1]